MKIPALLLEWPAAFLAHVFAALMIWVANMVSGPSEPLFKAEDVMEISMSGPPKSDSRMVQKASRTPDAVRGSDAVAEPPPPNQSDMAFRTPDAPVNKGQKDADLQRQKIMDDMKREQLLKDLSAPIGTQNRQASDPNGSGDGGVASGGIVDPEMAKWQHKIDQALNPYFKPIACRSFPTSKVGVAVTIDGAGVQTEQPTVAKPSGYSAVDSAGVRAVQQGGTLPTPPPRFASSGLSFTVTFECKNAI